MTPSPRRRGGGRRRGATRPKIAVDPLQPTADPPDIDTFDHWPIHEDVLAAIAEMGITKPTPIQALSIGPVLEGKDVIAKAETGTGKTLAFGTPMISKVDPARRTVLGLVLSPTRELAEQVHDVLEKLGAARNMRTALIVGGEDMRPQVEALQNGAQVVVGTPGRVLDLMGQGFLSFPWTEFAILDEADKMLEIGFIDDVKKILDACNEYRQTLLFSATFPPPLLELARTYTTDPAEIATASGIATVDTITQRWMPVDEDEKSRLLARMIDRSEPDDVFLVFCDRRTDVDRLLRRMERQRFSVKALHGGYDQAARFRVMSAFRQKDVKALLATDVASRGLDVAHVTHVVNFGVPRDHSDYTHRIGRTGRAGRKGVAVTLVSPSDRRRWTSLRRAVPFDIEEGDSPFSLIRPGADTEEPARDEPERPARGRKDQGEREERPRRERRPRRDEETAREERPRRGRRDEGEERPRRERKPRRDEEAAPAAREERPRRRREEGEREERPRRERQPRREERPAPKERAEKPEPKPAAAPSPGGFGAGVEDDAPKPQKTKRERAPRKESRPAEAPPKDDPPSSPSSGFGAGL